MVFFKMSERNSDHRLIRVAFADDTYPSHSDLFALKPSSKPSFAAITAKNIDIPEPSNPLIFQQDSNQIFPSNKHGAFQAVKINSEIYKKRLVLCQNSLIARVILSKGETPWQLAKLKAKLSSLWNLKSHWRLISLGRGFFHVLLATTQDKYAIWSHGSLNLKPGILRLQRWSPGFDPHKEKTTTTHLWVRLYRLPWELWDPQIL